jgi:uncharacterized RDD family membrane protein YckC
MPASVWRRFMAVVYEGLLLFGPLIALGFVYSIVADFSDAAEAQHQAIKRLGLQALLAAALLGYFTWSWSGSRCTLPMQTLGLRLETREGQPLSVRRALARALLAAPSTLTGLGFIWALLDRDRQSLHDRLTGTRLLYMPVGRLI